MTLNGHFDGQRVVLDDPIPADIAPNTPARIVFPSNGASDGQDAQPVLEAISRLAVDHDDLPADFAEQHEHYVKGAPRR